jgi:preprotein translocase subunit SecG
MTGAGAGAPARFGSVGRSGRLGEDTLVLTTAILILHIIVSVALIFLILMHSGKGGGLSDMFGGAVGQAAAGSTVVEKNLDRITVTVAIIFAFTSISLTLRLH